MRDWPWIQESNGVRATLEFHGGGGSEYARSDNDYRL